MGYASADGKKTQRVNKPDEQPRIIIYTDGACKGNPGPGGYGILMLLENSTYKKTFYKGFRHTTNNRMELKAVVEALNKIKKPGQRVIIVTDSKYISDAINKGWLDKWIARDFKNVKNADLWRQLARLLQLHQVEFMWVKGHDKHPQNNYVDRLAVKAASFPPHRQHIDRAYELINPPDPGDLKRRSQKSKKKS